MTQARPTVLLVYYTFSHQTERVADVIAAALAERGVDVTLSRIELTDVRWAKRFERIPMRYPLLKLVGMLPAQIRQATGEIRIPPEAQEGDYDVVVIGSPTWWFRVCCAHPLVPPVARSGKSARRQALRRVLDLAPLLEAQRGRYQATRPGQRGTMDRPDALRRRRQPGPVDARVARLHVRLHLPRPPPAPAADEPPGRLRVTGAAVRRSCCRSCARHPWRHAARRGGTRLIERPERRSPLVQEPARASGPDRHHRHVHGHRSRHGPVPRGEGFPGVRRGAS